MSSISTLVSSTWDDALMSALKGCAFSEMSSLVTPAPYLVSVSVAPELLSELQERLKNTRWSYEVEGTNWGCSMW
jgi:hypothetical protein